MESSSTAGNGLSWPRALALGAAAALLAGLLILPRLGSLPGLHLDEAWAGECALDFKATGRLNPLGMNWYTGPYHVWLVGKIFGAAEPGVFSLRLPGAVANIVAAGLFACFVARIFGLASFLAYVVLILALPFYPFESRLAWEVTAFNNLLAGLLLMSCWSMFSKGRIGFLGAAAASYAAMLGTANHLIFFSLPFGLALGFAAWRLHSEDERSSPPLLALFAALCGAATMLVFKKNLSKEIWLAHSGALTAAFWLAPALLAALACRLQSRFGAVLSSFLAQGRRLHAMRLVFKYALGAGLLAFLWFHATAFIGVLSGINVYKRLFSLDLGAVATTICFIWAGAVIGLVFQSALAVLRGGSGDAGAVFAALALAGYFAGFTIFRNTNSMRYYLLAYFVFAFAGAVFLPRAWERLGRKSRIALALVPLFLLAVSVKELAAPQLRRPMHFLQGWHDETSAHMTDLAWLSKKLENDKTCRFEGERFVSIPLYFLYLAKPWPCERDRVFSGEYCYDCVEPPYIR